jgi:hypothetical protein
MNKTILWTWRGALLFSMAAYPYAMAQESTAENPPPPLMREMPPPESMELTEPPGPPPGVEAPVDIWMERLKNRNPDEFQRFHRMRHQDPEGFHKELRNRLGRERMGIISAAHPRLQMFLQSLSESERMEILQALGHAFRPDGPPPRIEPDDPEARQWNEDLAGLARKYRETSDKDRREKLQSELRGKLGEMFDAREKSRARHIERIQSEAAKLQQMLDSRRSRREEIIERRLRELTEDETLKW